MRRLDGGVRLLPALTMLAAAGCGSGMETGGPSAEVLDSAGVRIVQLGALESATEWELVPLWTVGVVGGEPVFDVVDPFAIEVRTRFVGGGRVAVVEGGAGGSRVHILDARTGDHLGSVGRAGEGPEEFIAPRGVVPAGDGAFVVWDWGLRRATLVSTDMTVLGTDPIPDFGISGFPALHPAPTGLWVWMSSQLGAAEVGTPLRRGEGVLALWQQARVDTIARFPGLEYVANGSWLGAPPWGGRSWSAAHPEGVWLGDVAQPEVRLYDRGGLREIVRWHAEVAPRTNAHDAEYMQLVESAAPPGTPQAMLETMRSLLVVERLPFWGRMVSGTEGRLWISTEVEMGMPFEVVGPAPERRWVVLSEDGIPSAEVRTPEGFELGSVRDGIAIGVHRDTLGVETVRAFEVVW